MADVNFDDLIAAHAPATPMDPALARAAAIPVPPLGDVNFDDLIAAHAPPTKVYSGALLPFSNYSDGSQKFDSDAGVVGAVKHALVPAAKMTQDVLTGQVDPLSPDIIARSANAAPMAAGMGMRPGANAVLKTIAAPTADALHAAGGAGFDAARDLGVDYSIPHVGQLASGLQQHLYGRGFFPAAGAAPVTHSILQELQKAPPNAVAVPLSALMAARQGLGRITGAGADPAAAGIAKGAIDRFIASPPAGSVMRGPAPAAADILDTANANWAAGSRSDALNGIERAADFRSSSANSGANIGNSTRQRISTLLLDKGKSAGFDPSEISSLQDVVHGSFASNRLRGAANYLGGGGGMGSAVVTGLGALIGHMLAGEPGMAIGAMGGKTVGPALKAAQNSLDTGALSTVDNLTRQNSPLFRESVANAPYLATRNVLPQALSGAASAGIADSLNNAPPDSKAAALAKLLAERWAAPPPARSSISSAFDAGGTI